MNILARPADADVIRRMRRVKGSGFTSAAAVKVESRAHLKFLLIMGALWLPGVQALNATDTHNATLTRIASLTLEQAVELAEQRQPQLAEARAHADAAAGRALQAGAFPNPEAVLGAQQLPLDSNASNQREYVAGLAQSVPLGGRLGRAREAEALDREVRLRGLEVMRRNLRQRVHGAFATALYQDQAVAIQQRMLDATASAVATTRARVNAGDVSPDELARIEMELARARVEARRSQSLQAQAMTGLLAAIGDDRLEVQSLEGQLDTTFAIPTLESLAAAVHALPEVQLAEAELRARNAGIELAQAERIPDVRVELLYHRLEASRENTLDVGLSIPLPLFNRNQGRLREARAEAAAAEARSRTVRTTAALDLRHHCAQLDAALSVHRVWATEMLPRAEAVLASAEARYTAGDIGLTELLPARRDWALAQLNHLESLRDVMQAWNQLSAYVPAR